MRFASLLLKPLALRLAPLSELSLGTLPSLLCLFALLDCRYMTPKGFSLLPLTLSSGYARLMLKLRKETPSCHGN
jgi:hypothetical protein